MNDEWGTPPDLIASIEKWFYLDFVLDAAASDVNHKCPTYITQEENSLETDWVEKARIGGCINGPVWLNPPYSRGLIGPFMKRAAGYGTNGLPVMTLIRFDPSAKWFQQWVHGVAAYVYMLHKRIKFEGAPTAYNFPTCLAWYPGYPGVVDTRYRLTSFDWKQ